MIEEPIRPPSAGKEEHAMSAQNKSSRIDEWMLQKVYRAAGQPAVRLGLRNGVEVSPKGALPAANIVIQDRKTLFRLLLDPEAEFGDAYSKGRITLDGDLVSSLEIVYRSMTEVAHPSWYVNLVSKCMEYVQRNSLRGSRRNIQQHYDLNTDFYQLWLDPQLVYTCAYYPSPGATLEQAQVAKLDYVCRKVQLQPGERVVEAGCGWGALAIHMAKNFGVTVRAFNISREQILVARRRANELGLSHRVEFIEDDYRNIAGECDAFVSVGMLEHVGRQHYRDLGSIIHRSLAKNGRGLLHFIGHNHPLPFSTWTRKHIFPGAYAPTLGEVMQVFEPWDLSVLDVENLRLHYAKTLEHWLARFEKREQQISEMFSPEFMRAWRLYLAESVAGFRVGTLQLFQIVFARTDCRRIPWTRAHLYTKERHEEQETTWMHATS
ncbi:MAG: cyclopropane-fatty-acyl-phospholipid synthase [Acidobacteria bacterium]|jgi:cyclopropane-fatty-acyl-phospholipid synthase|nr:MAG: cyclopropane-fatty-acyl-phospholipid synthase [Acidobacteriota bacterium]